MSAQPGWEFVANLGDVNPIDYGGYFVFRDRTGFYTEEAELLEEPCDDDRTETYTIRRFSLERCTLTGDILSDNKFHPDYPAWFATPESRRAQRPRDTTYLKDLAEFTGVTVAELCRLFCSADPVERAHAYRVVGEYHGWQNLDEYPLRLTRAEVEERYQDIKEIKK